MNVLAIVLVAGVAAMGQNIERRTCPARDGVTLVYSAAGAGDTALVFIHGGMADRSFYDAQLAAFRSGYRVIALDLGGHGESGTNRTSWGIPQLGADVKAVADAERLTRIVLLGNSLGGPVAVEAALLMPERVLGVIGIDTFQDLAATRTPDREVALRARAAAFKTDYAGALHAMVGMLFHKDADPALVRRTEARMMKTSPAVAYEVLGSLAGYDAASAARRLKAPLRTINGDLYPTDVEAIRRVKSDFEAVVMPHMGHYPMLERPQEFNRHVAAMVAALENRSGLKR